MQAKQIILRSKRLPLMILAIKQITNKNSHQPLKAQRFLSSYAWFVVGGSVTGLESVWERYVIIESDIKQSIMSKVQS